MKLIKNSKLGTKTTEFSKIMTVMKLGLFNILQKLDCLLFHQQFQSVALELVKIYQAKTRNCQSRNKN